MDIPSKNVIKKSTNTMAAKNGSKGLITFVTEIFATPAPTKRIVPTGGVHLSLIHI